MVIQIKSSLAFAEDSENDIYYILWKEIFKTSRKLFQVYKFKFAKRQVYSNLRVRSIKWYVAHCT